MFKILSNRLSFKKRRSSLRQFANSTVPSDDQQQPPISAHALRTSSTLGATEATSTTSACVSATGTVATSFSAQGKSSRGSFGHADSSASIGVADSEYDANDVDYDSLYDDDVEADVQLDAQGSVIKHLLSQVKIGMDLTKVVLPTFILERRSLLEMYADYFAHPDIFVKIADLQTPRDRMVQVVRWYLSSYHAGRKSSVAKKPYNPILGEVFRCHWEIPPVNRDVIASSELASDGPVPWSKRAHLSFVAEQVSHHPPISAFYAEQYDKRISFNAHIYTRSKFLGLSICVQNIGSGVVSLLDLDEHYEVTFPNGYGRSILTVPWIELGGPVEIRCEKTGYSCHIDFITKAFYSKHTHRIEAEVSGPKQPKFLTINGEWNGVMEAKWSDKEGAEEFIDVNRLAITTKQVRPISQQDENESRRLWRDVTAGLKINNIQKATDAKARLEAKQRIQAKERKESNVNWETKLFSKRPDDSWYYTKPLKQRLQSSNT